MATLRDLFKGSPQDKSVKADKETFIEQETSGIRVKSLVELNNPLIYGNEATRIALRSTPLLEDIKSNANGGTAGGGLIGGKINQARDFVNSTIGIPEAQTPSRLVDKIDGTSSNDNPSKSMQKRLDRFAEKNPNQVKNPHSQIPITKDIVGSNGTEVGKFLKQSGGGNPKTIGKQALGSGIGVAKDLLRGELFGEGQNAGTAQSSGGLNGKTYSVEYTNDGRTYSDTNKSKKLSKQEDIFKDLEKANNGRMDLTLVSPVYGVIRSGNTKFGTPDGQYGKTKYALGSDEGSYSRGDGTLVNNSPLKQYTEGKSVGSLENRYGIGKQDTINKLTITDLEKYTIDDNGVVKDGESEIARDLIPFNIGKRGGTKIPFRATISGLTENVSPSWTGNKFLGNPFSFYTYSGVERSTSFNFKIFCLSPAELTSNWEKIQQLTKMTYPSINSNNLVNPPLIQFRLGDIYYNKDGFIDSLTYTMPDNGTWETDGDLGYLPKIIEVAITIKLVETPASMTNLYGYKLSEEALTTQKELLSEKQTQFDESQKTSATSQYTPTVDNGITSRGVKIIKSDIKPKASTDMSGLLGRSGVSQTPSQKESGIEPAVASQSSTVDKLKGKTPIESMKDELANTSFTSGQLFSKQSFFLKHNDAKVISKKDATSLVDPRVKWNLTGNKLDAFEAPGLLCMVGTHKVYKQKQVEFHSSNGIHSWSAYV